MPKKAGLEKSKGLLQLANTLAQKIKLYYLKPAVYTVPLRGQRVYCCLTSAGTRTVLNNSFHTPINKMPKIIYTN